MLLTATYYTLCPYKYLYINIGIKGHFKTRFIRHKRVTTTVYKPQHQTPQEGRFCRQLLVLG